MSQEKMQQARKKSGTANTLAQQDARKETSKKLQEFNEAQNDENTKVD